MNIIKNIIIFFKRLFNKENNIKMIDAPEENLKRDDKEKFINSLKINVVENYKKNKIKTMTCFGDGLGIQTKITY